jgi:hypothetical protein
MADYTGALRDDGFERSASVASPLAAVLHTQVIPAPGAMQYLMRGWRPGTADYETWIAVGAPNTSNPSGQPIVGITIQASWN